MKQLFTFLFLLTLSWNLIAQNSQNFPDYYHYLDSEIKLKFATDRILVKFHSKLAKKQQLEILETFGIDVESTEDLPSPVVTVVRLNNTMNAERLELTLNAIEQHQKVEYASPFFKIGDNYQTLTKEFIVKLNNVSDYNTLSQFALSTGAVIKDANPFIVGLYTLETKGKDDALTLANIFHESGLFEYAEPNFLRFMKKFTNDPLFADQWSIENLGTSTYPGATADSDMDVNDAWAISTGSGTIKVAVLDEGVDLSHPDLINNLLTGYDATGQGSAGDVSGDDAHGTACAGIIAAEGNNSLGMAGVAYSCKIIPVRIAYSDANGSWVTSNTVIGNAITWAWQTANADVLSNSWGGGGASTTITNAFNDAITQGRGGLGASVLVAAGNDNGAVSYPATLSDVISVAAMSMCNERKNPNSCDGETWWGSNYGNELDIAAPGVKIVATDISGSAGYDSGDYTSTFNGTSSATPNAAGVMALILSVNPTLTEAQARVILESTCDKAGTYTYSSTVGHPNGIWNVEMGYGRVNALAAVNAASNSCASPTSLTASNISTTSATVSWTSTVGLYNIEYGPAGFTPGTGTLINGFAGNSYTISTLTSATAYDFYVQTDCNNGDVSLWANTSFITDCATLTTPYTEDWENGIICWTQDAADDFDWTRQTGATPSSNTGPTTDNTTGSGYYLFIETSSGASGDIANTTSGAIDVSSLTSPYLEFFYHMYGGQIGTLNVDVEFPVGSGTYTNVFSLSGDQGNSWQSGNADLSAFANQTIALRFQAIHAGTYEGDIAIDDISIIEGPSCIPPNSLSANNITTNNANITWTSSNSLFNIQYGIAGFTFGSGTVVSNITSTAYNLTGLAAATTYEVYVQNDCGGGDLSSWVGPISFQTLCANYVAPFLESFDASTEPPCWSQSTTTGGPWLFTGTPAYDAANITDHTGNGGSFTWLDFSGSNSGVILETPEIDVSGLTIAELKFYLYSYNITTTDRNIIFVEAFDGTNWSQIASIQSSVNGWQEYAYALTNYIYNTNFVKIRFRGEQDPLGSNYFQNDIALDDISINELSSCVPVSNIAFSNISGNSADVSWLAQGNETAWNIQYGLNGFTLGSGTTISGLTTNPSTISNLSSSTAYDIYVQANCGVNGVSNWFGPVTLTTLCQSFVAPYTESFDSTSQPMCWSQSAGEGGPWVFTGTPGYAAATATDHTGNGGSFAWIDFSIPDSAVVLQMNSIDISALTTPSLKFYLYSHNTNSTDLNELYVEAFDGVNWNQISMIQQNTSGWVEHFFDLTNYTNNSEVLIRFRAEPSQGTSPFHNDLLIDDITIDEVPSCFNITSPSISLIDTIATVTWTAGSSETNWNIEYGTTGFTLGSGASSSTNTTTFDINNLTPYNTYDVYIQADCGNGDLADFVGPISFSFGPCLFGGPTSPNDSNVDSISFVGNTMNINHKACDSTAGVIGVENLTNLIADVTTDSTYTLDVIFSSCSGNYYTGVGQAWIDWNQNFLFDSTESLGAVNLTNANQPFSHTFSITVPSNAKEGMTYLRIMQQEIISTSLNPCSSFSWGSVMDFGISVENNIITTDSCLVEWTDLVGVNLSVDGKTVTKNGANGWDAGVRSIKSLPLNEDGWVETEILQLNKNRAFSLSTLNSNTNPTSLTYQIRL
ncbi:MAG: S8 family serine peptidase, partial [Saprospiraceae bacterium]